MSTPEDPEIRAGHVDAAVADEFPDLRVRWCAVDAGPEKTPDELREELRRLSSRFSGSQAIALRGKDVPHAYRVFFRHVGLDPDTVRVPAEALALERLRKGGFKSHDTLHDAITLAVAETGVPVWGLDGDLVEGESLVLRPAGPDEVVAGVKEPEGRLLLADDGGPVARLFGPLDPERAPKRGRTRRTLLVSVQVKGVSDLHVEEALWRAAETLWASARA